MTRPPWSTAPNAPKIPMWMYCSEKADLSGSVIAAMLYGIIIGLFIRCIRVLLDPVNRKRGGIRWPYVAHATTMFSLVTIHTGMSLHLQSISFIDNRNFPGVDKSTLTGPIGYQALSQADPIRVVPDVVFLLNNLLADGLLVISASSSVTLVSNVSRTPSSIFYDMNRWYITLPCTMYLTSFATGLAYIREDVRPGSIAWSYRTIVSSGLPYYSISLSLNALLTVMIIYRLVARNGKDRNTMENLTRTIGLYKAVVTMFVESLFLYLIAGLLFIRTWNAKNFLANFFSQLLVAIQAIATYLIILRVADRRAITKDTISGNVATIRFKSQGRSTYFVETVTDRHPMSSMDRNRGAPGVPAVGAEDTIEEVPL